MTKGTVQEEKKSYGGFTFLKFLTIVEGFRLFLTTQSSLMCTQSMVHKHGAQAPRNSCSSAECYSHEAELPIPEEKQKPTSFDKGISRPLKTV